MERETGTYAIDHLFQAMKAKYQRPSPGQEYLDKVQAE